MDWASRNLIILIHPGRAEAYLGTAAKSGGGM